MTIRELEKIDSGLKILSYECDDFLNEKKLHLQNLFSLYFFYCGFILYLKRLNWKVDEPHNILRKFPRLFQPALLIILPLVGYLIGLWFTESVGGLLFSLSIITGIYYVGYKYYRRKLYRDLLIAVRLCSDLRMQINKIKQSQIQDFLS